MRFSAEKFKQDKHYRKLLPEEHIAILDGREAVNGHIDYEMGGEEWRLFPVLPEWCADDPPEATNWKQNFMDKFIRKR